MGWWVGCDTVSGFEEPGATAQSTPSHDEGDDSLVLLDADSQPVRLFSDESICASVFIFSRVDCPISNRYAPEVARLINKYADRKMVFWLVYPDSRRSPAEIDAHHAEFAYPCGALIDAKHQLVKRAGVQVTPEVAVYKAGQQLVYRGRIDDRFVDYGRSRHEPTVRDLEQALQSLIDGQAVVVADTVAIGCPIEPLPGP